MRAVNQVQNTRLTPPCVCFKSNLCIPQTTWELSYNLPLPFPFLPPGNFALPRALPSAPSPPGHHQQLTCPRTGDRQGGLKSNFASCHGVAQLGLVVDEGHEPQVGLDEDGPLQHQHPVGTSWHRALLVGFLHSLDQLRLKVLQLEEITLFLHCFTN